MEVLSIRFNEDVLEKIDENIKEHNFNSRTEFIREAVRDKMAVLDKERLMNEFLKFRGKANKKTTYEENEKTREIVIKELAKEKGWKI